MRAVLIFFLLFFPFKSFCLVIVEAQIKGEFSSNDYIKIYNEENEDVDIEGWKIRKRTSTGKEYSIRVFPKKSLIQGKGYFIWANSKDDFHLSMKADSWSSATIAENNSIALFDSENNIIDAVTWGENSNPFNEKGIENPAQKLIRKNSLGVYENTGDNGKDFYIYPPFEEKDSPKETAGNLDKTEKILFGEKNNDLGKIALLEKIDINSAVLEELIEIRHIGKARAEELISLRPFYSVDDLARIKGIGEKSVKDIKEQGLAWADSEMIKEKVILSENGNYETASMRPVSYNAVLIAIAISIFSASIIYLLKSKIKS